MDSHTDDNKFLGAIRLLQSNGTALQVSSETKLWMDSMSEMKTNRDENNLKIDISRSNTGHIYSNVGGSVAMFIMVTFFLLLFMIIYMSWRVYVQGKYMNDKESVEKRKSLYLAGEGIEVEALDQESAPTQAQQQMAKNNTLAGVDSNRGLVQQNQNQQEFDDEESGEESQEEEQDQSHAVNSSGKAGFAAQMQQSAQNKSHNLNRSTLEKQRQVEEQAQLAENSAIQKQKNMQSELEKKQNKLMQIEEDRKVQAQKQAQAQKDAIIAKMNQEKQNNSALQQKLASASEQKRQEMNQSVEATKQNVEKALSPDQRNPKLDQSRKSNVSGKSRGSPNKRGKADDEEYAVPDGQNDEYYDDEEEGEDEQVEGAQPKAQPQNQNQ